MIKVIGCKNKEEAAQKALDLLFGSVNSDTLLLLSGGTSPDLLYKLIAGDKKLKPGAFALIDERFGEKMHDNSNEKMVADTGLAPYMYKEEIFFGSILQNLNIEQTALNYEATLKKLFAKYAKKIAIMGIGADGHTAGIKPDLDYDHKKLVVQYDDSSGSFGKRVTLTFEALDEIDEFIVLAFGENKKEALHRMFTGDDKKVLPAVFFAKTTAKATLLTDLNTSSILKE